MRMRVGSGLPAALVLTAAWWALAAVLHSPFLPSPPAVVGRLAALAPTVMWRHLLASLGRVAAAGAAAFLAAVALGIAAGRSPRIDRLVAPFAYLLYPVPKVALLPLVMLLFGLGELAKVLVVFLVLFFQMLLAVRDGARQVAEPWYLSLRSLGARRRDLLRYVTWPALLPQLYAALRVGVGTALAVLFFAETFGTRWGLGYFVVESWMRAAYADMLAGVLVFALVGLGIFRSLDAAARRALRWQAESRPLTSG